MMKIYISGKVTGLEFNEVLDKFQYAESKLMALGFDPVNPMKDEEPDSEMTWEEHMLADIRDLFNCRAVYMLRDWKSSKGARIEHAIATELDIGIVYQIADSRESGELRVKSLQGR